MSYTRKENTINRQDEEEEDEDGRRPGRRHCGVDRDRFGSVAFDRSVGRSVDGGGGGDARRRARAVERRPGRELNFGSVRDSISIRVRSAVVPVVDRARDHGRKDR